MMPAASGSLSSTDALVSASWADSPATSTGKGAGRERMSCTMRSPAADTGSTAGTTENHVPSGEAKRTETGLGGATRSPPR